MAANRIGGSPRAEDGVRVEVSGGVAATGHTRADHGDGQLLRHDFTSHDGRRAHRHRRAELDPETEAGVRDILDRLGDPASIAAEANLGMPPPPPVPIGPIGPATSVKPSHTRRNVTLIVVGLVAAVLLLCCLAPALALIAFSSSHIEEGTPTTSQPPPVLPSATTTR
jgi:hypothetical protein